MQRNDVEIEGKVSFKLFFRFLFRVAAPGLFFLYDYFIDSVFFFFWLVINNKNPPAGDNSAHSKWGSRSGALNGGGRPFC